MASEDGGLRKRAILSNPSTLKSRALDKPEVPVQTVPTDDFADCFVTAVQASGELEVTIRAVAALTFAAKGGCAFAVAEKASFQELQARPGVNFEVVDRSPQWADGYLTTRLRGVHVREQRFREAVEEFTSHDLEVTEAPGAERRVLEVH